MSVLPPPPPSPSTQSDGVAGPVTGALPDDELWHRLSPRMLLVHPVVEIVRVSPGIAVIAIAGAAEIRGALIRAAVTALIVAALGLSRWFTTWLRLTPGQIQLRSGLLRRRTLTAPRATIRTVDVTAHPMHRALGLARVVVGTGIDDRRGRGRIVLDGLPASSAADLRARLLGRSTVPARDGGKSVETVVAGAAGPVEPSAAADAVERIATLDRRWIRLAPFTLSGFVTGLVVLGFLFRAASESGRDALRSGPATAVERTLRAMPLGVAVVVVLAVVLAFVALASTAGYVLLFWDFRLERDADGTLGVRRGLLTTRSTSIERRRLVGVELAEALVLRWVRAGRLLTVATGLRVGRGAERGGEVLLPPAPRNEARRVAAAVLRGSPAFDTALRRHPAAAARRRLARSVSGALVLFAGALAGRLTGGSGWPVLAALVLLVLAVPLGVDRYRSLGHGRSTRGELVTRLGSLNRRTTVLAGDAVIGWTWRSSVFQRRTGVVTLVATTAAGRQGYEVLDVGRDEALRFATEVTPGLLEQFCSPSTGAAARRPAARHRVGR